MNKKKLETLLANKTRLAEKYEHMSKIASSVPKRTKFQRQAANYRYQAKMLGIKITQC